MMMHAQQEASMIPKGKWERLMIKLKEGIFDAGESFGFEREDLDNSVRMKVVAIKEEGVLADDPESIWLVDHAFTFLPEHIHKQLQQHPQFVSRLQGIIGDDDDPAGEDQEQEGGGDSSKHSPVERVMRDIWRFANTYRLSNVPGFPNAPLFYIQDEFGSRIGHADNPTLAMVPFFYVPESSM